MLRKPYTVYTAEEFALDDLFVRWVQHPDDEEVAAFWHSWLTNNPGSTDTIDTARTIILEAGRLRLTDDELEPDEISSVWGRIRVSLETMEDVRPLQPDVRTVVGWWYLFRTVAAVVGIIGFISWAVWMQYVNGDSLRMVSTGPAQTRQLELPDQSKVTLYANSLLKYAPNWYGDSPRAVWLEGTADFSVVHRSDTSSSRLFRVHTNGLTIEALGTSFQVQQRPQGVRVGLRSGRVNLLLDQQQTRQLMPGDSVDVVNGSIQALP
ncbi:FecR family protein [Spirosoma sp. KUDC1026]|uniref:FecR family protein n=1 Tax=Spirosoma sp. KUDC1026 TaxID=2745947 RepID=UPI00159BA5F4|nr:FecR family protein [Spirosoma sp. KUDC1026]QKZ12419.1 FecR domain-containing protein [Spirosoma sp. KUDC1026]